MRVWPNLLVPPRDTRRLVEALSTLVLDEKMRREMGEKGRIRAEEYGWEKVAQRVVDYYNKILREAPVKTG